MPSVSLQPGQKVYIIVGENVKKMHVVSEVSYQDGYVIDSLSRTRDKRTISCNQIGKNIFLSIEEAEAALILKLLD